MPNALDKVAWIPLVEELIVIMLPAVPVQLKVPVMVVVVEAGKVIVLGASIVKLLNVLAPVKIIAPVPTPVMVKWL